MSEERTRFEVLLEEIRGQLGAVADGHNALNEKMDHLGHAFGELSKKVDIIDLRLLRVEQRVDKIETNLTTFQEESTQRFDRLEHDVHSIKDHLGLNGVAKPRRKPAPKRPRKTKR